MNITTKFDCGDSVYLAGCQHDNVIETCADCAGSGRMKIEGHSLTIACVTCMGFGKKAGRSCYRATARALTVGQVSVTITNSRGDSRISNASNYMPQRGREERYMCDETGVISGSVYKVENLFETESEALEAGAVLAFEAQARHEERERQLEKERAEYARRIEAEEAAEGVA